MRWIICLAVVALAGAAGAANRHSADQDGDYVITASEVLRVIQFFNFDRYHCAEGTEDGYAPGPGSLDCGSHASDYAPADGEISLSELLRLIQLLYTGSYYACAEGEDGFCWRYPEQRPNVLFLLLDTLRGDRIGLRRDGHLVMPYLTSLAARGTNFTRAWSAASWTRPSMSSIHSGQYPNRFAGDLPPTGDSQTSRFDMGPEVETMTEWLNKYGFDPWAVLTNASLPEASYVQGLPEDHVEFLNGGMAIWVTETTLGKMPQWKPPFFAYAHYMDAHGPFAPPLDLVHPFDPEPTLEGSDAVYLDYSFWRQYTRDLLYSYIGTDPRDYGDLSPTGIDVLQSRYDRDCYYMDGYVEQLVETVLAAHPNTIVVVTADHGDSYFDRGPIIGHGHSVYEEQIHVPLIFYGPGIPAQTVDRRVSNMSIQPTLARLLEISPEPQWQGQDLLNDTTPTPLYALTRSTFLGATLDIDAVLDGTLKLIDDPAKYGPLQLYDLATDPGELNNLAPSRPDDVQRLKAMLDAHILANAPEEK